MNDYDVVPSGLGVFSTFICSMLVAIGFYDARPVLYVLLSPLVSVTFFYLYHWYLRGFSLYSLFHGNEKYADLVLGKLKEFSSSDQIISDADIKVFIRNRDARPTFQRLNFVVVSTGVISAIWHLDTPTSILVVGWFFFLYFAFNLLIDSRLPIKKESNIIKAILKKMSV